LFFGGNEEAEPPKRGQKEYEKVSKLKKLKIKWEKDNAIE